MSDIDIAIISDYHFLKHGISCVNRIRIPSENVEKHINLIEAIVFLMELATGYFHTIFPLAPSMA